MSLYDDVSTPGAIIDIETGTWAAVNRIVRDGDI